jgi:hypothetical protein
MSSPKSTSAEEKIWIVAHAYITTLLRIKREHGFQMTGKKSWDFMKWNALGPPMISRLAIEKFYTARLPDGSMLMKETSVSDFTAGREKRGRCFVAEHTYPTKALQSLIFTRFANHDPSPEEVRDVCRTYNRICYIWYEEDKQLNNNKLRSSLPRLSASSRSQPKDDPFARYRADGVDIEFIETILDDGYAIFRVLDQCRQLEVNIEDTIKMLAQPS